jgi:hypothetical protein
MEGGYGYLNARPDTGDVPLKRVAVALAGTGTLTALGALLPEPYKTVAFVGGLLGSVGVGAAISACGRRPLDSERQAGMICVGVACAAIPWWAASQAGVGGGLAAAARLAVAGTAMRWIMGDVGFSRAGADLQAFDKRRRRADRGPDGACDPPTRLRGRPGGP